MKLNRKQLRKLILQEMKMINEQSAQDWMDLYNTLEESLVGLGFATMSPVRFAMTYFNHKSAIDDAYEQGGASAAASKWAELHGQLIHDVGQEAIDALDNFGN